MRQANHRKASVKISLTGPRQSGEKFRHGEYYSHKSTAVLTAVSRLLRSNASPFHLLWYTQKNPTTHSVQETFMASSKSVLPQPGVLGANVYHPSLAALAAKPSHMCGMSPKPPIMRRPRLKGFFWGSSSAPISGGIESAIDLSSARSWRLLYGWVYIGGKDA